MFNLKLSKTVEDIQWSFISLAASSFAHLLLRVVIGKELGPLKLGLYTLTFTIYIFGMQFGALGIGQALTKYIAEFHDNFSKIGEFVSSGIVGSVISGSIMGLFLYLLSRFISVQFFHSPEMINLLKITALCFPFIAIQKTVLGILTGLQEMKWYAIVNVIQNVSVMVVSIALVILFDMGVEGAVVGFVAPTIIVGLLSLIFVRDYLTVTSSIQTSVLKEVSRFGFYIALANSIGLVNSQIDSLMIGNFMDETEVGYYAVAVLFIEGLRLIPSSVETVTFATVAKYYGKKDYGNMIKFLKSSIFIVFIVSILISFALALFGQSLIEIFFGIDFLPAYKPLLILLVGNSIYAPIFSINSALLGIGKVALMSKISLICAVTNTILNILLIPAYGITGAAIATSISLIVTGLVRLYFINVYIPKQHGVSY